jgi:NAD(P)-dependent dehydrogenase (short-subunit alcohol dehydrogenase family)
MTTRETTMKDKRVLITGASQGIGRDLALGFAAAGAVVVLSARQATALAGVQSEIDALGGQSLIIPADVTDPDSVTALATTVRDRLGGLDILINNAGASGSHKFLTHPDELWHRMLAVNLTGVYYVTKAFAGGMVAQEWGRIITIASTAAKVGGKYIAAYTAAKHGALGLTRALAVELAPHVTVNAICPGYVDTPMTEATLANITARTKMTTDEAIAIITQDTAQKRLIQPNEITALALYMASDAAVGLTGQAVNIDGGGVMS